MGRLFKEADTLKVTYFERPDHSYHRVIFEFTDKERKGAGVELFSLQPKPLEIIPLLHRIANTEIKIDIVDLQRKKDGWKGKALRLIGFLNDKSNEVKRLQDKYEKPGQKCGNGHINNLPLGLWDCPVCTEKLRSEIRQLKLEIRSLNKS